MVPSPSSSVAVAPPALRRAVGPHGAGVIPIRRRERDGVVQSLNHDGRGRVGRCRVTELAVVVVAPASHRPVRQQRAGGEQACRNSHRGYASTVSAVGDRGHRRIRLPRQDVGAAAHGISACAVGDRGYRPIRLPRQDVGAAAHGISACAVGDRGHPPIRLPGVRAIRDPARPAATHGDRDRHATD